MTLRRRIPLAVTAVALLAGCGDRNLVLNVDVLSYLDPSVTHFSYGPLAAVPGGLATGEVVVVNDTHVHLIERPNDVAKVQSVLLTFAAMVTDSTGSGLDTLRLYMSDEATNPLATPPAVVLPMAMTDGQQDSVRIEVGGDQRMVDLFNGTGMRVSATNSARGPSSGPPLTGRLEFTEIRATVVAGRKGL